MTTGFAEVELPEGAMVHCQVIVTGYFDADGELRWMAAMRGDAPTSTFVGLVEMAKAELVREAAGQ